MTYDAANRLTTSIQGTTVTTYTFDGNGSRTLENANGSLTSYSFDRENRLTQVGLATGAVSTYTYSADGLRRSRAEVNLGVRTIVWDGTDYLGEF